MDWCRNGDSIFFEICESIDSPFYTFGHLKCPYKLVIIKYLIIYYIVVVVIASPFSLIYYMCIKNYNCYIEDIDNDLSTL